MDSAAVADDIEGRLRRVGSRERAEGERRYLKSQLDHIGAGVPQIRRVATRVDRDHPEMGHDDLVDLVSALWDRPVHERRMAAVELLALGVGQLSVADAPLLERLLHEAQTWAVIDPLAIRIVGLLAARDHAAWDPVIRRWATDGDRWVRRAGLLAHLPELRRGEGDFARFGILADGMLDDRDAVIRKAIGWVLRETGRQRPDLVTEWLLPRSAGASGLTVREAVRHLPEADRRRIAAARSSAS